eukprot:COSAG02_NODE_27673_length_604_cov_17.291089_1_plen_103_part_00
MSILRFGEKVLGKASGALKFGEKVTGIADRVGHKVAARASSAIDMAAPFIGSGVAGKARAVVGVIKTGADMAHTANQHLRPWVKHLPVVPDRPTHSGLSAFR